LGFAILPTLWPTKGCLSCKNNLFLLSLIIFFIHTNFKNRRGFIRRYLHRREALGRAHPSDPVRGPARAPAGQVTPKGPMAIASSGSAVDAELALCFPRFMGVENASNGEAVFNTNPALNILSGIHQHACFAIFVPTLIIFSWPQFPQIPSNPLKYFRG